MQRVLDLIEKIFLSVTKNKKLILSCFENEALKLLNCDVQAKILNITVKNPLCLKYPPPVSYQKFFLRCLYDCVERFGSECSDDLAKVYTDILLVQDVQNVGYHSYKIDEKCTITLQENSCFVAKSTTGLQTWEAAKYLSEWCIRNRSYFESKTILELGSGIGLLGIIVLKFCDPEKYIFSDKSKEVLKLLSSNIKINLKNHGNGVTEQQQLTWADINNEEAAIISPDVILGTDIVFDINTIGSLIQALNILMIKKGACAYIASTIRNPETDHKFRELLGTSSLTYQILESHQKTMFIYDDSSTLILYKIFKESK
ncbi:Protein-lysine N-methyltransferase EEF2KMT like protein [Argiope bruennichi]|uniref:Protein-lysine N-methyltransferase EEF2KMT like protein n=2 Tax=Argiope bruennichi TaxID=94029 RepID=A0A8T0E925_ARGBR|nr:Protein-lysine N-methyltransferase EEF2KMT like protein [Argiope bruennichi]